MQAYHLPNSAMKDGGDGPKLEQPREYHFLDQNMGFTNLDTFLDIHKSMDHF